MSRFLPDRLHLGIEPGRITMVRTNGHWRTSIVAAEQFVLPVEEPHSVGLSFLERELRMPSWQHTRIHVVVADTLVRYFIAQVPEGTRSLRELQDMAALRCEEIFGEEAKAWTVAADLTPFTSHHLGCTLRTNWLEGIRGCCRDAGLSLASITPFGISEFNRNERHIGHRSGWFAAAAKDSLCLGFKAGTGWRSVQIHRRSEDALGELPQWLAQHQLRAGIADAKTRPLWLAGDLFDLQELPAPAGTILRNCASPIWPGADAAWSRTFRLALSPVWPRCA